MHHVPRKPVEWRQLCAIASNQLEPDPSIDDAEWKAKILDRLARLGFADPDRQTLTRAMSAAERAHEKRHGPRPVSMPQQPSSQPPTGGPLNLEESLRFKAHLEARGLTVKPRTMGRASSSQPNRTFEQIRDWKIERGLKTQAANRAEPEWIRTPTGWERRQVKPNSDEPSNDSVEGTRDDADTDVHGARCRSNQGLVEIVRVHPEEPGDR